MERERIWLTPGQTVPDRERRAARCPELMLTGARNPSGLHGLTELSRRLKFSSGHYTTERLERIKNWWKGKGAGSIRKLIAHADNMEPHGPKLSMDFMDANRMTRIPYSPY
jgi:hypothetical protein